MTGKDAKERVTIDDARPRERYFNVYFAPCKTTIWWGMKMKKSQAHIYRSERVRRF